ncbi:MAG: hypothetical protein IKM82_07495 [Oscillospiraceae bacterium]|nr:hypothetical protein [Oscillospiraceae bacterium]
MKHGWLRRTLILLIAVGLCVGMVFYSRKEPETPEIGSLTLWYVESDCPRAVMENLLTRCRKETGIQVKAIAFANESFLAATFESETDTEPELPDLIFCSHMRAALFEQHGILAEIASPLPISDSLANVLPAVGRAFFPIGSRIPVMLLNTSLTDGNFDSFEALLTAAGDAPFLGCDCWAELLYAEAAAKGIRLTGETGQDFADAQVAALYNELAMSAFRGGLVCAEHPVEYVRQGMLPCAVTMSTNLSGLSDKALDVCLLPLPEGAEIRYPAELMGFALLDGADTETAETFFRWLWNGACTDAAIEACMAPIFRTDNKSAGTGLGARLDTLTENLPIFLPEGDEPFTQNRAAFEDWLREALDLLN